LTWGETEYTQVKGKKTTPNESRCFALTSNDLFGVSLFPPRPTSPTAKFIFNSPAKIRGATQLYKISTFVSTEKLRNHANSRKRFVGFFAQLSRRGARELFLSTSFGFSRNFRRVRLPTQFVKFQNTTLDTRSAATFESDNAREK